MNCGDIYRDTHVAGQATAALQACTKTHSPTSVIRPVSSMAFINSFGNRTPRSGVLPSQQSLASRNPFGLEIKDRLKHQKEFTATKSITEVAFEFATPTRRISVAGVEKLNYPTGSMFGIIKCLIGIFQEKFRTIAVPRRERNPNTGASVNFSTINHKRTLKAANNSSCQGSSDCRIRYIGDDYSEFVSTQSRDQINLPHRLLKAATDLN